MIWGKKHSIMGSFLVLMYLVIAPACVLPPSHYNIIAFAFLLCLVITIGMYYFIYVVCEKDEKDGKEF